MIERLNRFVLDQFLALFLCRGYKPLQVFLSAVSLSVGLYIVGCDDQAVGWLMATIGFAGFGVMIRENRAASMTWALLNVLVWSHQTYLLFHSHGLRPVAPATLLASAWIFLRCSAYSAIVRKNWLS